MKHFESFGLDVQNECLWHGGEQIVLPPRAFAVLRYLVENPGRLISHDELLDKLWPETYVQPQVLRTYMLELRKIFGDDARQPRFIRSQPKRGYVFVATVHEQEPHSHNSTPLSLEQPIIPAHNNPGNILIGRDRELSACNAQVERLAGGMRQMVLLSGDPGMGKTTLVDEFCNQWTASGAVAVARGQCVEGIGAREQYYPILEALAQLCAGPHGEHACGVLARLAPEWLPAPARNGQPHPPGGVHPGSVNDLCAALEDLAADKPLILVLEDIHWADSCTLEALSALARRRTAARLMILATLSTHHMPQDHPLRALRQDLRMRHLCEEINLPPLRTQHVAALLRLRLEQDELPQGLDSFMQEHAEGNPLFVFAILDHLIAERFLIRTNGADGNAHWEQRIPFQQMEAGIPEELAQMIELEIGRLSPAEQRLLEAASLIDVAFPAWAVAAALEEEIPETEEALDNLSRGIPFLCRAGHDELPDGERSAFYAFAHRLYREVLYQRQSAATRARRHTRVANRLSRLFAGREFRVAHEMAIHLEAAGLWQRAIDVLKEAAGVENMQGSRLLAGEFLQRALRITPHLPDAERAAAESELQSLLLQVDEDTNTIVRGKNQPRKQLQKA